jgi:hypothetical protein
MNNLFWIGYGTEPRNVYIVAVFDAFFMIKDKGQDKDAPE